MDLQLYRPDATLAYSSTATTGYAISAAVAALIATLLLYVLMLSTPEPVKFFYWIAGLFTVIITILPFMYTAGAVQQLATAIIDLIVGIGLCVVALSTIENWAQWVVLGVIVAFTFALMFALGPNRRGSGSNFKVGR